MTKNLLCLDIGTASVKACVAKSDETQVSIIGTSLIPQAHGNVQGGTIIHLASTIELVQEAVKRAENMAKVSAQDFVLGLSSEMVKGMTVRLPYHRTKPDRPIDDQELKSMIYELHWQAFDLIRKNLADELCIAEADLKLLNASVVGIRVENVLCADPRGLMGELVEMEIFHSFSPVQHFGNIQTLAVELPFHQLKGVFIESFSVAHCLSLKDPEISAVVIDIGAGVTDVSVVHRGRVMGNRSFSMGGNSITKRISHELSTSFQEAESIKIGYSEDNLDKKSIQIIREAIAPDIDLWITSLNFSLKEMPMKMLPSQFLLCGKGSLLREFSEILKDFPWKSHYPLEDDVSVRSLQYADLMMTDIPADEYDMGFFPLIAVARTAFDLMIDSNVVENMLSAIIGEKN